jgi:hypothetical protein
MGTPETELEPKYSIKRQFTEGDAQARASETKEFLLRENYFVPRGCNSPFVVRISVIKFVIRLRAGGGP